MCLPFLSINPVSSSDDRLTSCVGREMLSPVELHIIVSSYFSSSSSLVFNEVYQYVTLIDQQDMPRSISTFSFHHKGN